MAAWRSLSTRTDCLLSAPDYKHRTEFLPAID